MLKSVSRFSLGKCVMALLLATMVVGAIGGCAGQTTASGSEPVALYASDDGSQIELRKGHPLLIALEGNPSTGYNWQVEVLDQAVLNQVGEPEFEAESDLVGAPGTVTLRFQAVGAGETELKLVHQRGWEQDAEPLETFTVQVTVS